MTTADSTTQPDPGYIGVADLTPHVQEMYDGDVEDLGFVMNVSRVWGHLPEAHRLLGDLLGTAVRAAGLTFRQRGILVTATASTMGDSYCSLAWGLKLTGEAGADLAGSVLRGEDGPLDDAERALASWARAVARDPNATTLADVRALQEAGYDDTQIFAITVFVAIRIGFSTVNDALGVRPDQELADLVDPQVLDAVTFGRPLAT